MFAAAAFRRLRPLGRALSSLLSDVACGGEEVRVAASRLLLPASSSEDALRAATQVAYGRCVAALNGRAASFALHFSTGKVPPAAVSRDLAAAHSLFSASPLPSAGAAVTRWDTVLTGAEGFANADSGDVLVVAAVALPPHLHAFTLSGGSAAAPSVPDLRGALTGARPPHLLLLSSHEFATARVADVLRADAAATAAAPQLATLMLRLEGTFPHASVAAVIAPAPAPAEEAEEAPVAFLPAFLEQMEAAAAEPSVVVSDGRGEAAGAPYVGIGFSASPSAPDPRAAVPDFAAVVQLCFGAARGSGWSFSEPLCAQLFAPSSAERRQGYGAEAAAAAASPAAASARLPLFLLDDLVLLPRAREELMVYEPRYRLLLRAALEAAGEGVPTIAICNRDGVGTLAALTGYNLQVDGRAHLALLGGRRFQARPGSVAVPAHGFGLALADVDFFDDEAGAEAAGEAEAAAAELRAAVGATLEAARALPGSYHHIGLLQEIVRVWTGPEKGPEELGWAVANVIARNGAPRRWLEGRKTGERLREIARQLEEQRGWAAREWLLMADASRRNRTTPTQGGGGATAEVRTKKE